MGYIKFNKKQLINLKFSLSREILRSNRAGTYASTTLVSCNTRKYHGLLVCPMPDIDHENHVLLSSLDVSITQNNEYFNLGIHKYPFIFDPRGHKYIHEFKFKNVPEITYIVGGITLKMERILSEDDRLLIRYTIIDANNPVKISFKPFLAFRNIHKLSKANLDVNKKYSPVSNGIKISMYNTYKPLFMQFSKKVEYIHVPDWYYNIEYEEELRRGYEYQEDLFVPGYFETKISKGDSIIFSAGLSEINTRSISAKFSNELSKRLYRGTYLNCLKNAAEQFIVRKEKKTEVIAGFPWFGRWGRDTFISLPGLTLSNGDAKTCEDVLKTITKEIKHGLFPNIGHGQKSSMNSVDAPLWFFWVLQKLANFQKDRQYIWEKYYIKMKNILNSYQKGTLFNIKMHENGLIFAGEKGKALTWMDAVVNGTPVTPRIGYCVEINALWYNAIMFSLQCAKDSNDNKFINSWKHLPDLIKKSYINTFWCDERKYLADYVFEDTKNFDIRPNQIFPCSLTYSPLTEEMKRDVTDIVRRVLLTPKGIRTLSPDHRDYKGVYEGRQEERDMGYHQGTAWPWLLGHFCEAYLKLHEKSGLEFVKNIYNGFKDDMTKHGIGSVSEVYDGDPPHNPGGAISQAWSVAELLRINELIKKYQSKK